MFTARIEHDIGPDISLRNVTRWGRTTQNYMLTGFLGSPANLATPLVGNPSSWTIARSNPNHKDQTNKLFANQTSLSARFGTGALRHSLNAGVELMREEQSTLGYLGPNAGPVTGAPFAAGSWPAANLYHPNPDVNGYRRVASGAGNVGTTDTVGAYVVGGGARHSAGLTRGTDVNGTPTSTAAYWVFDAMASWQVAKNVELQFNLYNLFDKD